MESAPENSPAELSRDSIRALNLTGRDFLKESDFTPAELASLLELSAQLKFARLTKTEPKLLAGNWKRRWHSYAAKVMAHRVLGCR